MHVPRDLSRLHVVRALTYARISQKTEYMHIPPTLNQRPRSVALLIFRELLKTELKYQLLRESFEMCLFYKSVNLWLSSNIFAFGSCS